MESFPRQARRARRRALGRTDLARRHYASFLRRYDAPAPAQPELVQRARRSLGEAEARPEVQP